tara:strand:+ start:372 stop:872 length:501 start_codon:yes stop_codon:yes gene_type:complete
MPTFFRFLSFLCCFSVAAPVAAANWSITVIDKNSEVREDRTFYPPHDRLWATPAQTIPGWSCELAAEAVNSNGDASRMLSCSPAPAQNEDKEAEEQEEKKKKKKKKKKKSKKKDKEEKNGANGQREHHVEQNTVCLANKSKASESLHIQFQESRYEVVVKCTKPKT